MVLNLKMFCGSMRKSTKKIDWGIKRKKKPDSIYTGELMFKIEII
jgi:hypothetical protein